MTTAAPPKTALTVQLPVCPSCRRVGKIPTNHFGGKDWCAGPIDNAHKRVRMKPKTFRLVEEGE